MPTAANNSPRRAGSRVGKILLGGLLLIFAFAGGYGLRENLGQTGPKEADAERVSTAGSVEIWTCSMHPQIRQPNFGLCPLCAMDLIPASSENEDEATSLRELSISREARELLNIQTFPVERRYVTATIRMVGKVDYDETRLGSITAWVPGRLDRLYVDYTGIEVQKGDHMVYIYSPELYSAQAELIRARQAAQDRRSTSAAMSAERLLESAREKLRLWGMTDPQIQEIELRDRPSDHLTIYAPMAGIVIEKSLQEGAYVDTGTQIYTIADLSHVWVRLDAYESDLVWLRYGQDVEFTTEAYPGEIFLGRVAFIDPVLNPKTRTVKVRVDVPNPHGKLKPEMFVNGRVRAEVATGGRVMVPELADKWICRMHPGIVKERAGDCDLCDMPLVRTETLGYVSADAESAEPLVVPSSAVLRTGTRAIVYVERSDADRPTYEGREIVLGPRTGDTYLVHSGLSEGERVVVNGNFKLDSALQLSAKPSMMSPEAGNDALAGHVHGGSSAIGSTHPVGDSLHLPIAVMGQLSRVLSDARAVSEAVKTGDRDAVQASLRSLEDAIDAVDATGLEGQAARLWKELAMRLRNAAVEGRWALSDARIQSAVAQVNNDVERLRAQFQLTDQASPLLAGGPFDVPPAFRSQLDQLWQEYLQVQQALANDDPEMAHRSAETARKLLKQIDMSLLGETAHDAWMSILADLKNPLERMAQTSDLDELRTGFEEWSMALMSTIVSFGLEEASGPVYQLYCSMAFDFQGASWLQSEEQVHNPYFGAKMLRCADEVSLLWKPDIQGISSSHNQDIPESFRDQVHQLWETYLALQEALASDDFDQAKRASQTFQSTLEKIETPELEDRLRSLWNREQENLSEATRRMTRAEELAPLRAGFALLSEGMSVLLETFRQSLDGPIYQLHCPMAFNNRGATWLQAGEEVRNPYFGATMLRCADKVEPLNLTGDFEADREVHNHE